MLSRVPLQLTRHFAGEVAFLTYKRFLASVKAYSKHWSGCKRSCTGYMWKASLRCVWECAFWDPEIERNNNHTAHTWKASLLSGWACASWGKKLLCRRIHTVCRWKAFLLNALACVSWGYQLLSRNSRTVCSWRAFLLNESSNASWGYQTLCRKVTLVADERLFSWTGPYVSLEVTSLCAGVVALFAVECLHSCMG